MIYDYTSNSESLPLAQSVLRDFTPELQWSPNFIISVVLKGTLNLNYKNHTRRFSENDIFFFAPFEMFSVVHSSSDAQVLCFTVDSHFIQSLCPDIANMTMQKSHVTYNLNNPIYVQLCKDFATIIFNSLKSESCSHLKLMSAISHMMVTIIEAYGIKTEGSAPQKYVTQRIIAILQYINDHYMHKITVNDIAAHLGIHPQYFSSFFTKQFHTSFIDYLTGYRINRSLERLIHSDDTILEIALDHGFSNHKTYGSAFQKFYQMSPMQYRKNTRSQEPLYSHDDEQFSPDNFYGVFSFFRTFLDSDLNSTKDLSVLEKQQILMLDTTSLEPQSYEMNHSCFLTVGRAYACLRSEVQEQIRQAAKDCSYTHVRFRDIFSDDLYVYYEDSNHEPIYNWQSLDLVFDFLLSLGLTPFPEIGFMPERLASKKQYSGWQYHPNVSYPKSLSRWADLLRNFLQHYIERYGLEEVRKWYFDFWTAPDLDFRSSYWNESMEDFFAFYHTSYDVFKEVDPLLLLGTPNFSTFRGDPWYRAFFQYCTEHQMRPAYVAAHIYGCELMDSNATLFGFTNEDSSKFSVTNPDAAINSMSSLRTMMEEHNFSDLRIIVSDWSLSFMPKELIRDTCYMGPYIAHTYTNTIEDARALCFWSLSDIHEDFFPESTLFRGGPGMMDYHGFKKASYNTFVLLGKLGQTFLSKGSNYLFVKKGDTYQLLLYNLADFDYLYSKLDNSAMDATHRYHIYENTDNIVFKIAMDLPKGTYYIKKYEVNRNHGSAYDIWSQMGFPTPLSKDMEDHIRTTSVPHVSYAWQNVETTLLIDETVPAHGVMLVEISPK